MVESATISELLPWLLPLLLGYGADLLLGDPRHWPHPVKGFGHAIGKAESLLNRGSQRLLKGLLLVLVLVTTVFIALQYCTSLLTLSPWLYYPAASLLVFWGLANRNLIDEVKAVDKALTNGGLPAGRRQLSMIVGRDTSRLDENQIRTAALETLSENLSDGVIAPLFYYLVGGLPLMWSYKMVNTLDSMLGYKSDRYRLFGRAAARLDDVANFVPARLTALLMVVVGGSPRALRFLFRYGHRHTSPNAGYPEAALAGILDLRFGGPATYHGQVHKKPWIGERSRAVSQKDLLRACAINQRSTLVMVVLVVTVLLLQGGVLLP